jgi:hypothetical protein
MRSLLAILFLLSAGLASSAPALAQGNSVVTNTADAGSANSIASQDVDTTPQPITSAAVQPGDKASEKQVPKADSSTVFGDSVYGLVKLFVLAVVLESALALLFLWRPFIAVFDGRGVKSPISLAAALLVTLVFHTDIFAKLVYSYGGTLTPDSLILGRVIEAMVIAGGSAGVHTMLLKLGIRLPTGSGAAPQPPANKAWLAISLKRRQAKGPVQVELAAAPALGVAADWQTSGTILGNSHFTGAARYFFRDFGRFPNSGGWSLTPGTTYLVRLTGMDAAGGAIEVQYNEPLTLAAGAIVDIDLTL